jgi:glycogen(starch) synthase
VAHLVAPSQRFAGLVASDYGVDRNRLTVVPNPVDLDRFQPAPTRAGDDKIRITYVGRASVRKGIEQLVELSHRLDDLADQVELELVCSTSLWSDYTPLLAGVNPRLTVVREPQSHRGVAELLQRTDVMVQPSHYEPFGLTVAEGLASGVPIVATDEVGAVEGIDPRAATVVPAGDVRALERAVRVRIAAVLERADGTDRAVARAEAERRFDPKAVVRDLAEVLERVATAADR